MLTTTMKFEGSDGTIFSGSVNSDNAKEFQKLQRHIVHSLIKLGDDAANGITPKATDAKVTPQIVDTVSMETTGDGFYSNLNQESRFDHQMNYAAHVDFCKALLADATAKFSKKK